MKFHAIQGFPCPVRTLVYALLIRLAGLRALRLLLEIRDWTSCVEMKPRFWRIHTNSIKGDIILQTLHALCIYLYLNYYFWVKHQ